MGTIAGDHPLALSDTIGTTFVADVRWDSDDNTDLSPRLIDKSDGGSGANGYSIYIGLADGVNNQDIIFFHVDSQAISGRPELGLNDNPGDPRDEVWAMRWYRTLSDDWRHTLWIDGVDKDADNISNHNQIPAQSNGLSIGNWNHSDSNRQWNGLIRRLFVWGEWKEDAELKEVARRQNAWSIFELYGRASYFIPSSGGAKAVTGAATRLGTFKGPRPVYGDASKAPDEETAQATRLGTSKGPAIPYGTNAKPPAVETELAPRYVGMLANVGRLKLR